MNLGIPQRRRHGREIRSRSISATVALLVVALVTGCRGDAPSTPLPGTVEVGVSPTPPVVGPALIVVRLYDEDGEPVSGARVEVEGTMSHAGMVPVHEAAVEAGEGAYRISEFGFTMAGDWILRVHVTLPDGTTGTHRHDVRVASDSPP